jgi:hypothetical protein
MLDFLDGKVKIGAAVNLQENLFFNDSGVFATSFSDSNFTAVAPDNTE